MSKSMYYDINKTLSYNTLFNFVVGPRGAGKTYAAKKRAISNFLKRGEQFVYLRRYDTELPANTIKNFFDDVMQEFPDHEFKSNLGVFRIDGAIAGWYFPLSKATMMKSTPFPNVSMMIFDEFIIDVGMVHYLPKEVTAFLECYSTVSRDRDIPVFFLSNAITFTNPYFLYFDITLEEGQRLKIKGDISLELVENPAYTDHVKNTRFGKLIANTEYGKYNMENKFLRDTDTFITKMSNNSFYVATLIMQNQEFGIYRDMKDDLMFISEKIDPTAKKLVLDTDSHNDDTLLVKMRGSVVINMLLDYYTKGNVRFETQKAKNMAIDLFRRLI